MSVELRIKLNTIYLSEDAILKDPSAHSRPRWDQDADPINVNITTYSKFVM